MRVPKLHRHKSTGHYYTRWGGKQHWLGSDRKQAQDRFLEQLEDWQDWRDSKAEARRRQSTYELLVPDLVERFLASRRVEIGLDCEEYYRKHLIRFMVAFRKVGVHLIRPLDLAQIKEQMIRRGFAPRTINHDLKAVKTMWRWGSALDLCPAIDLGGVRGVPVGPVKQLTVSRHAIECAIRWCPDRQLRPWLAINYLALLRPSEVLKVVHGQGEFVEHGVFRLDRGKMDRRAAIHRHCIFSDAALAWLELARPVYSRMDSYSHAMRRWFVPGAKVLQKSAAQHLVSLHDAGRDDVELLLGHVSGRLKVTYHQPAWQRLRGLASLLSVTPS